MVLQIFLGASFILLVIMLFSGQSGDHRIKGGFFFFLSLTLFLVMFEAYFYSVFERANVGRWLLPFEIGRVIFYADDEDLTKGLMFSDLGDETMRRLGFDEKEIKEFLKARAKISFADFASLKNHISIKNYAIMILKYDKAFADMLFFKGLQEKEFAGALEWVIDKDLGKISREQFWSREMLGKIPGIGKNWAYGQTYVLDRYGEDITKKELSYSESFEQAIDRAVTRLESVLARGHGSNAVVVSNDESSRMDTVNLLAKRIHDGRVTPNLEHKRVFLVNANLLIENAHDKISFENDFTLMLAQSARAENIIIAIPYFSSFIRSAATIGSDVLSVLAPYITSPLIHIVALDSSNEYHSFLSSKEIVSTNFEMITSDSGSEEGIIGMLEKEAEKAEAHSSILMTYPALLAIAESVKRYFDLSAYADKAKDILLESFHFCAAKGTRIIKRDDIFSLVELKTGIPTSVPKGEEREGLLHLEEHLHERIIGQDEAVKAVSEALKRSRAGVHNPDKPIGTFLFLGPTGVGKTETTKALADIFFGSEARMSRLDMSEYRDAFAMERLIGSFGTGRAGALSMMLREKPYGVLLLDEFEKTTSDIVNLFLRIFDEGVFTDADGRKVNAKNNIVIATSNAGSDLIWEIIKSGASLESKKDQVIDTIIKNGIFKPELLNRFDAVVLFHPLAKSDLEKIAVIMIKKFSKRMRAKGIAVEASTGAIQYLVAKGTDPKFGARPMNRAIQEEVEKLMAEKIIEGSVKLGSKVTFEADEQGKLRMKVV